MMDEPRAALSAEREQVLARLAGLERDLAGSIEAAQAANADDEHDPEGATIAYERQQVAAHIAYAQDQLRQVDAALGRLDAGSYGTCVACGRAIPPARLAARPAATTCIDCASSAV
jgi:DnaK suppressor protein